MRILGLESSSLTASVALVTDDVATAEYTVDFKKTHSQTLLPMLDEIVRMVELDLALVDGIAVSSGPGSFTGLRIGSATGKGLGLALKKPLISVPTVAAMAYGMYGYGGLVCPIMDARRNQVYTGIYDNRHGFRTVREQCAMEVEELAETLNGLGRQYPEARVVFLGDGTPVYREQIKRLLTVPFEFAPPHLNRQRAASVAALGSVYFLEGRICPADKHVPDYLRKPQAEREREEGLI